MIAPEELTIHAATTSSLARQRASHTPGNQCRHTLKGLTSANVYASVLRSIPRSLQNCVKPARMPARTEQKSVRPKSKTLTQISFHSECQCKIVNKHRTITSEKADFEIFVKGRLILFQIGSDWEIFLSALKEEKMSKVEG